MVVDLGPAGQARPHRMAQVVKPELARQVFDKAGPLRTRTDHRHVALEDVQQLWDFVQPAAAQEHTDLGDARIVLVGPFGAILLGVGAYAAQLVQPEYAPAAGDALLAVD